MRTKTGDGFYADNIKKQCIKTNREVENRGKHGVHLPRKTGTYLPKKR